MPVAPTAPLGPAAPDPDAAALAMARAPSYMAFPGSSCVALVSKVHGAGPVAGSGGALRFLKALRRALLVNLVAGQGVHVNIVAIFLLSGASDCRSRRDTHAATAAAALHSKSGLEHLFLAHNTHNQGCAVHSHAQGDGGSGVEAGNNANGGGGVKLMEVLSATPGAWEIGSGWKG